MCGNYEIFEILRIGIFVTSYESRFFCRDASIKSVFIRINIKDATREQRGWKKTAVDDDHTETELDSYSGSSCLLPMASVSQLSDWDYVYSNDSSLNDAAQWVEEIIVPIIDTFYSS
jgi:hypothetical protein